MGRARRESPGEAPFVIHGKSASNGIVRHDPRFAIDTTPRRGDRDPQVRRRRASTIAIEPDDVRRFVPLWQSCVAFGPTPRQDATRSRSFAAICPVSVA